MSHLTALVYYLANTSMLDARHPIPADASVAGPRSPYRLAKVFGDGTVEPVAQAKIDLAIRWVRANGWPRSWGFWINDNPALVWARLPADFIRAWGHPELQAPCRYASNGASGRYTSGAYAGSLVKVGLAGVIAPTRSRREVWELRARFPAYWDDILFVPIEVLVAEARIHKADEQAIAHFFPGNVDKVLTEGRQRRAERSSA